MFPLSAWKTWKTRENFTLVREKPEKFEKVVEIVVYLWCATAVLIVTK